MPIISFSGIIKKKMRMMRIPRLCRLVDKGCPRFDEALVQRRVAIF